MQQHGIEKDKVKNKVVCCYFDKGILQVIDRYGRPQICNMPFKIGIHYFIKIGV